MKFKTSTHRNISIDYEVYEHGMFQARTFDGGVVSDLYNTLSDCEQDIIQKINTFLDSQYLTVEDVAKAIEGITDAGYEAPVIDVDGLRIILSNTKKELFS